MNLILIILLKISHSPNVQVTGVRQEYSARYGLQLAWLDSAPANLLIENNMY